MEAPAHTGTGGCILESCGATCKNATTGIRSGLCTTPLTHGFEQADTRRHGDVQT